jgi:hypothetical protein
MAATIAAASCSRSGVRAAAGCHRRLSAGLRSARSSALLEAVCRPPPCRMCHLPQRALGLTEPMNREGEAVGGRRRTTMNYLRRDSRLFPACRLTASATTNALAIAEGMEWRTSL